MTKTTFGFGSIAIIVLLFAAPAALLTTGASADIVHHPYHRAVHRVFHRAPMYHHAMERDRDTHPHH